MTKNVLQIIRPQSFKKAYQVVKKNGPQEFAHRLRAKLHYNPVQRQQRYQEYLRSSRPTPQELEQQRKTNFSYHPCFGIVIPLYNTKPEYLQDLLDSFKAQTYSDFKLFLVDASPVLVSTESANRKKTDTPKSRSHTQTALTEIVRELAGKDRRIVYRVLGQNLGIAQNTNRAIQLALRDVKVTHIALCDHDDFIEPNTLFECTKVLNRDRQAKIIYTDEDVVKFKDDPEAAHVMKPDFDLFLLESCNYINHFFICEKSLFKQIKTKDGCYEQPEYNGAQDYDLYLRLAEAAIKLDQKRKKQASQAMKNALYTSSTICHLPEPLYHWRAAENSTAQDPSNKLYAYDAARRALEAHFQRQKVTIDSVEHTENIGTYRTKYILKSEPLVSVILRDQGNTKQLQRAIASVRQGTYKNIEFIVADDDQTAVQDAKGEILLFLDSNLIMVAPDSIAEMIAILGCDGVGAVGARLLLPNGTLQHAGLAIGPNSMISSPFYHMHPDFTYANRANCVTSYSAVSPACLMVKKSTYLAVDGFGQAFDYPLSGVNFCLKLRAGGEQVVYTPYARFRYSGRKSASQFETLATNDVFRDQWSAICRQGDPYYNPDIML